MQIHHFGSQHRKVMNFPLRDPACFCTMPTGRRSEGAAGTHLSLRWHPRPHYWPRGRPQPVGLLLESHLRCQNQIVPPRPPRCWQHRISPRCLWVKRTRLKPADEQTDAFTFSDKGRPGGQRNRAKMKERKNPEMGEPTIESSTSIQNRCVSHPTDPQRHGVPSMPSPERYVATQR